MATFSGLNYDKAETMNIAFSTTAGGFTATSTSVVVSPAAASQLVITQEPSATATAGQAFGTQPIVMEEDPYGNVITTDSTHTVTAARGTAGTASLQGSPLTVTLSSGVATFSGLYYDKAETMNIGFSTTAGSFTAASSSVTVSPTTATMLGFTTNPGGATAGAAFATQPVVKSEDAYGNPSTVGLAASDVVTIAINTGSGTRWDGHLRHRRGVGNGTITGSSLEIDQAGSFTLSATAASGLTAGDSGAFTVSPAAATQFVFTQEPSAAATAGTAFAAQPILEEEDQFGNVVTTDSTNTVTAETGTLGTAALQGTTTVTFAAGVATFSGLHYNKAETMNIIFTTTAGSFNATSNNVVVSPAAASALAFTTMPGGGTAGSTLSTQPGSKPRTPTAISPRRACRQATP